MFELGKHYTVVTAKNNSPVNATRRFSGVCTECKNGWLQLTWKSDERFVSVRLLINKIVGIIEHKETYATV